METHLHTKVYVILIILAGFSEVTRAFGHLTEVFVFLAFVIYEFIRFALESEMLKERKKNDDQLPNC